VPYIKTDKSQLKRFTSTKDRLLSKIKQLECPRGSYFVTKMEEEVPQEALALYLTPNPRNLWRATLKGIGKLAQMVENDNRNANPQSEIMSEIQRNCSRKVYVTFDIDQKGPEILEKVDQALLGSDKKCRLILETRGGYHILVRPELVSPAVSKSWYRNLATMADVTGDAMIPVPGTYQGGFTPHFL
jgi:hypothetical protein